jgi:hypothetical protein
MILADPRDQAALVQASIAVTAARRTSLQTMHPNGIAARIEMVEHVQQLRRDP